MRVSSKQRAAIRALVSSKQKQEAAAAAGVRPETVSRWLGQPAFRAELTRAQDAALSGVALEMTAGASDMLGVLREVALDREMPGGVRIRAAGLWLSGMWRAVELRDLSERLAALEARVSEVSR